MSCGTGQSHPPLNSEDLREFYCQSAVSLEMESHFKRKGVYARTAHQFLTFRDFINLKKSSVIEIGSNDAGWFKLCKIYRADSYSYFDSVRSGYIDRRGGRFLGFLDTKSLFAIESSSIDFVVSSHSLEHLLPEEVREIISGIRRVLKPQTGKLLIEVPLELDYFDELTLIPPHTLFFTAQGLIALLENVGFSVVGVHVVKGHKFGTYKADEALSVKRVLNFALMKLLLPERFFADSIVQLSARFYPPTHFDYLRILVQK